jgi:hypothetical protein
MDVEKNGGRLIRRPKLTLSCSAERKERNTYILKLLLNLVTAGI